MIDENEDDPRIIEETRQYIRSESATVITEEPIRVKTRDRRTAEVARRGGDTVTRTSIRRKPLLPALATASISISV